MAGQARYRGLFAMLSDGLSQDHIAGDASSLACLHGDIESRRYPVVEFSVGFLIHIKHEDSQELVIFDEEDLFIRVSHG